MNDVEDRFRLVCELASWVDLVDPACRELSVIARVSLFEVQSRIWFVGSSAGEDDLLRLIMVNFDGLHVHATVELLYFP